MESAATSAFDLGQFNPASPEIRANPYPMFHMLRQAMPICPTPIGACILTRYEDGHSVLIDKRFATIDLNRLGQSGQLPDSPTLQEARTAMGRTMLFMDPPRHGRIRGLVSKAFSPRMVESLRPRIAGITDHLIQQLAIRGDVDLIKEFAYPLPVIVIAEMLGVPAEDRDLFRKWTTNLAPLIDFNLNSDAVDRAMTSMAELDEYMRELVAERRGNPKEDLISALIAAEEKGDRLTVDEMMANIVLLLGAGHETTANLIGNGMLALLKNRGELERLQREPQLVENAVEECLRYDSPVQATGRRALENVIIGGIPIPKDSHAIVLIGACNRDPARFAEPDRFDITRQDNDHLAFGGGIHFCLGANLARVEGRIAIGALTSKFPGIDLAGDTVEYREMFNLRGLKSLPVKLQ
jgi:pimeloyl-[acyl-carrier protein] synthase